MGPLYGVDIRAEPKKFRGPIALSSCRADYGASNVGLILIYKEGSEKINPTAKG